MGDSTASTVMGGLGWRYHCRVVMTARDKYSVPLVNILVLSSTLDLISFPDLDVKMCS